MVCRQRVLLEQAERVKSYISTTGTATSELLAAIGLRNEAALVGRCRGVIDANTQAAAEFFSRCVLCRRVMIAVCFCAPRMHL